LENNLMVMVDAEEESGLIVARMTGSNVEIIKKTEHRFQELFREGFTLASQHHYLVILKQMQSLKSRSTHPRVH
jgi:hypothetical protein